MTQIVEYNQATGHTQVLTTVPDDQATEAVWDFTDHSSDHVVYARKETAR